MTEKNEIFASLPVPRALREMALPAVFSQIIVLIYNMADTFYLGQTNNPYMVAGVSLILPVFNICASLAQPAGVGGGALISRLLGVDRTDEVKRVSSFSFWLSLVLTAVFSVAVLLFASPLLRLLGASEQTFAYARQYLLCVIVLGGLPTVLSNVLSNLLRSAGYSKQAGFGITMGGVLNIALDPLFMFVLLPKGYEVLGVGIATLLSNCVACLYFLWIVLRRQQVLRLRWQGWPERRSIGALFNVGMPSMIAILLFDLDYVIIDRLMTGYGDVPLAAVGIVLKAERLPLNVGIGICQGMIPLVAYNYAAKNEDRMFAIIRYACKVGLLVGLVSLTLYETSAGLIMRAFIRDAQTVALGTKFLRIRSLATSFMFLSFFTVHMFQGFGKGNTALFLGVVRWAVLNIPMLFLLNHLLGMYGLVWGQLCADVITSALSLAVYLRFKRRMHLEPNR